MGQPALPLGYRMGLVQLSPMSVLPSKLKRYTSAIAKGLYTLQRFLPKLFLILPSLYARLRLWRGRTMRHEIYFAPG